MAGAHLDSVQEGPGINDNGSGSAALLETAIQMAKVKTANTVRFAWWGAEESGLLGSEHYVENLSRGRARRTSRSTSTSTWSPRRTTCSASTTATTRAAPRLRALIPPGSAEIEDVFERFYAERGEPSQDSEFSGRSDYGPFIAVGIPAGGLFTGAEVPKTAAEAALYGGVAGAAYDPCYHSFCDNLRGARAERGALQRAARGLRARRQHQRPRPGRELRRDRHVRAHVRLRHVDGERRGRQARQEQGPVQEREGRPDEGRPHRADLGRLPRASGRGGATVGRSKQRAALSPRSGG